jgi:ketosteroid isomerase-like protein
MRKCTSQTCQERDSPVRQARQRLEFGRRKHTTNSKEGAVKSRGFNQAVPISVIGVLAFSVALAGCSPAGANGAAATGGGSTSADSAAISQLAQSYAEAYNRKDVAAVTATYTDDAVELQSNGKLVRGRADLMANLAKDTATWGKLTITPKEPAMISGNIGYGVGATSIAVPGPGGQTLSIPGSYIVVVRKDAGAWKIAALSGNPDSAAVAAMMPPPATAAKSGPKTGKK